ncbi:MAG: transglutaminase-like cysteine peptidase [Hyphomicrobium sp.]|jgi:predicted transglutaminase-like cysteine proteinase
MKRLIPCVLALAAGFLVPSIASAEGTALAVSYHSEAASPFMRVYGPAQPPYGFVRFCETQPEACAAQRLIDVRFQPTPERLSELDEVNRNINRAIAPATDAEIYGVSEYWTVPVDRGDCEDYALLKQKVLAESGWPMSALLITVVRDEKGEGHAVLTVRTSQGDFILDNKVDDVKLWYKSGYQLVMRQSYLDPRVWVSLDASARLAPGTLAGVRNGQ